MKKLQLIGNIGKDAVIQDINGKKAINFNVAVNEYYKDKDGNKVEKTDWFSCVYWKNENQSVEIAKYLKTGTKIYLEGKPTESSYHNKNTGELITQLGCELQKIELL